MKKTKKFLLGIALAAVASMMMIAGCASSGDDAAQSEDKHVIIGASANSEPVVKSGVSSLEEMGYTVEVQVFDDFQTPNRALAEGKIDANLYQHLPFLEDYNKSNGTDLAMMEPVLWNYFRGLYSSKWSSIDEIPDGGTIGMAPEATNISLELEYLQEWGLIKLADAPADGVMYTEIDIVENPKNLKFVYIDDVQRYGSPDEFDAYTAASDGLFRMGYDVNENLLEMKADDSWALGMVVDGKNKDSQVTKDIMEAYTSAEAARFVAEDMQGCYIPTEAAGKVMGA